MWCDDEMSCLSNNIAVNRDEQKEPNLSNMHLASFQKDLLSGICEVESYEC